MAMLTGAISPIVSISKEEAEEIRRKQRVVRDAIDEILEARVPKPRIESKSNQTFQGNKGNKILPGKDTSLMSSIWAPSETPAPQTSSPSTKHRVHFDNQPKGKIKPDKDTKARRNNMDKRGLMVSIHAPRHLRDFALQSSVERNAKSDEAVQKPEVHDKKVCINPLSYDDYLEGTDMSDALLPVTKKTSKETKTVGSGRVSASVAGDTPLPDSETSKGTNPKAPPFTPTTPVVRGIRTPREFMEHFRAMQLAKAEKGDEPELPRRITFKNLPEWARFPDVLCLVHGGEVETVSSNGDNEVSIDFVSPGACKQYHESYSDGIRIDDDLITVELGEPCRVNKVVKRMCDDGKSRVVYINMPEDKGLEDLNDICAKFDIDHMTYQTEPNKPNRTYFFLTSLTQGDEMRRYFDTERTWNGSNPQFLPDPCAVAQAFHSNTIPPSRMAGSIANSLQ